MEAIFARRLAGNLAKDLGEIVGVRETHLRRHFLHGEIALTEQRLGPVDPRERERVADRHAEMLGENAAEVEWADVVRLGQLIERHGPAAVRDEVLVDSLGEVALPGR